MRVSKRLTPGRLMAMGFAAVILLGSGLLLLPISIQPGQTVTFLDSLFTSTSAVCVTGLLTVDVAGHFTVFGRIVIAVLIQIGGLGVSAIWVGVMLLTGKRVGLKERSLLRESMNHASSKGVIRMFKYMLLITLLVEGAGMVLSFVTFIQHYPFWEALGISAFHAVSSFNNAGFDLFGGDLLAYQEDILLNLTTAALIILGGLGFFVIMEVLSKRSFRRLSLHSKVVLTTTGALLVAGTLLIKFTEQEKISWLGAFFSSTSARTAGFATFSFSGFNNAGIFVMILLMFIGASPGSTGGGVKDTTIFVIFKSVYSAATNRYCSAFKRKIPQEVISKAFTIVILGIGIVSTGTLLICVFDPDMEFHKVLFEMVSAFSTVGLSTGITPELSLPSHCVLMVIMFIGRMGPLTIATMWVFKPQSNVRYAEENILIG